MEHTRYYYERKKNMEALKEALLEMARVIVLAILPVLITMIETEQVNWKVLFTVVVIAGLRFVDKLLHEIGSEQNNESLSKGLTRF